MANDTVLKLIESCNTPFYYFDTEEFIENYHDLNNTFKSIYENYQLSYSYKTNYTPYICELVKQLGGYAEVVSDMEYFLAKKIGYDACQIVYNGPAKGELLEEHILNGGIVNVDNYDEMVRICILARKNPQTNIKLGLRINMDVGGDFISRFGFELGKSEISEAVKLAQKNENVSIVGLHCHISRARGVEAWRARTKTMLEAVKLYFDKVPQYISLGSGMFGKMSEELSRQFSANVPTYKDYAKAVFCPIAEFFSETEEKPMILTEPGTTLVSRYIYFVTKVLNIKTIRERNMATVDGSFENLGEICGLKKLPLEIIHHGINSIKYRSIDIMGYTCLEQDVMYKALKCTLAPGDYLVFENAGGYSIVSKPQFIKPNCAMYTSGSKGELIQIMREETFEDVFAKFFF